MPASMPASTRRGRGAGTTRRTVLAAAVTVPMAAVAGCSLRIGQPAAGARTPAPDADELARERAAADADQLGATARSAARVRPADARTLLRIAADHVAHAVALRAVSTVAGAVTPTVTARSLTRAEVLPAQAAAERTAIAAIERDLPVVSADVARLLASVAASRAVHADELTLLARGA